MSEDEEESGTITRNIKVLRERLEETNGKLKVLTASRLKRRLMLALERRYPSRWKGKT